MGGLAYGGEAGGSVTLTNAILWGNVASQNAQISHVSGSLTVTHSDIQGGYTGTGNIDADPQFVDAPNGDLRLQGSSPAIDAGLNTVCPATGLRGENRDDWRCDMGAYETQLSDTDTVTKTVFGAGVFTFGPTLAKVTVDDGGCLTGLSVQRTNSHHPQATEPHLQTGVHWTLSPVGCSSGFTATLTLPTPNFTPDGNSKLCRWDATGSAWDCGESSAHSFDMATMADGSAINAVTRSNVNEFSQWTAGSSVGPTAISLMDFTAHMGTSFWGFGIVVIILTGLSLVVWSRKQTSRSSGVAERGTIQ